MVRVLNQWYVHRAQSPNPCTYLCFATTTLTLCFTRRTLTHCDARMECIRVRNWVTNMIIKNNVIEDCGIYDYRFQFNGKIGGAIYIGTSSNQVRRGNSRFLVGKISIVRVESRPLLSFHPSNEPIS